MSVYVASRARNLSHRKTWLRLRDAGWPIRASWLDAPDDVDPAALWIAALAEVRAAQGVVVYVSPEDLPLRGVLVEVGAALGADVPVVLVAPEIAEPREVLGSWVLHPLVTRATTLEEAIRLLTRD